jgi:hypothetical protein
MWWKKRFNKVCAKSGAPRDMTGVDIGVSSPSTLSASANSTISPLSLSTTHIYYVATSPDTTGMTATPHYNLILPSITNQCKYSCSSRGARVWLSLSTDVSHHSYYVSGIPTSTFRTSSDCISDHHLQRLFLPKDKRLLFAPIPCVAWIDQLKIKRIDQPGENKTHLGIRE